VTPDINIDEDLCVGTGSCVRWLPSVFQLDGNGLAIVRDVAGASAEEIEDCAEGCPTGAITVS
jgi:ferredoxin